MSSKKRINSSAERDKWLVIEVQGRKSIQEIAEAAETNRKKIKRVTKSKKDDGFIKFMMQVQTGEFQ